MLHRRICQWLFLGSLVLACLPAQAVERLRVCYIDQAAPPYLYPDHDGTLQVLLKMTAAQLHFKLELLPLPNKRCRESLGADLFDAVLGIGVSPQNVAIAAFPLDKGLPDPARALATVRSIVFRRKGSAANWDGAHFTNLERPVLVPRGYAVLIDAVKEFGATSDDNAASNEQNFAKLLHERGDLAIAIETSAQPLVTSAEYAGKLEMLGQPFQTNTYYAAFSLAFHAKDPAWCELFWNTLTKIRNSLAYAAAIKHLN